MHRNRNAQNELVEELKCKFNDLRSNFLYYLAFQKSGIGEDVTLMKPSVVVVFLKLTNFRCSITKKCYF